MSENEEFESSQSAESAQGVEGAVSAESAGSAASAEAAQAAKPASPYSYDASYCGDSSSVGDASAAYHAHSDSTVEQGESSCDGGVQDAAQSGAEQWEAAQADNVHQVNAQTQ